MINIQHLIDDAKCYPTVRELRWADEVRCPHCGSAEVNKRGHAEQQSARQRLSARTVGGNAMT